LAYYSMCNAFFMYLPVSSFVFHSSLLTVKSVDLVVACDGFLCVIESLIFHIFHRGFFDSREKFLVRTAVYNGLNLADDEA